MNVLSLFISEIDKFWITELLKFELGFLPLKTQKAPWPLISQYIIVLARNKYLLEHILNTFIKMWGIIAVNKPEKRKKKVLPSWSLYCIGERQRENKYIVSLDNDKF